MTVQTQIAGFLKNFTLCAVPTVAVLFGLWAFHAPVLPDRIQVFAIFALETAFLFVVAMVYREPQGELAPVKVQPPLLRFIKQCLFWGGLTAAVLFALREFRNPFRLSMAQMAAVFAVEAAILFAASFRLQHVRCNSGDLPTVTLGMEESVRLTESVAYCKAQIEYYECVSEYNFVRWRFFLRFSIVAGAVGTVLASIETTDVRLIVLRTFVVGSTAVSTGLLGSFRWQQESVRQGAAAGALRGELVKFLARTVPYDKGDDLTGVFVAKVQDVINVESQSWVSSSVKAG